MRSKNTLRKAILCVGVAGVLLVRPQAVLYAGNERQQSPPSLSTSGKPRLSGFTVAYRKAVLATLQSGRISGILVKEGQQVQAGELLVSLDSKAQACRTEIARLEAQSTAKLELARVQMEHARFELDRMTRLVQATAAADSETRAAQLSFDTTSLAHRQAEQEHAQAVESHRLQQELLSQYEIRAPFAGFITGKVKEVGETVEEREGVVELCQLDTLLVTVDCPLEMYSQIQLGDRIPVVTADGARPARVGEVTMRIPVADPGSQTFKLKLTVPNQDGVWIAGMLVSLEIEKKTSGPVKGIASSQPAAVLAAPVAKAGS